MSTGRSVREILRLVEALQTSDEHAVSTPEGWRKGDEVIEAPPLDLREENSDRVLPTSAVSIALATWRARDEHSST